MARWWRRPKASTNGDADWERVSVEVRAAREHRLAALDGQELLVDELTAVLFEADPIGLNFDTSTDEYAAEAQSIALRLPEVSDLDQLRELVHQEFVRWFDADLAGSPSEYTALAQKVLTVWHRHHPLDIPATIRVMPDYDCWPTWDDDTGRNIDPESLPITRRLVQQLNAWAARYDEILNGDDPTRSELADPQEVAADGQLLAELLSCELSGISQIDSRRRMTPLVLRELTSNCKLVSCSQFSAIDSAKEKFLSDVAFVLLGKSSIVYVCMAGGAFLARRKRCASVVHRTKAGVRDLLRRNSPDSNGR